MPMHVCLATPEFPPVFHGGIATYNAHLARILREAGHRVTVLTSTPAGGGDAASADPVPTVRLDATIRSRYAQLEPIFGPESRQVARRAAFGLAARDWLLANADSEGIDVVEAPEFGGSSAFLVAEALPPVVVTCHGSTAQVRIRTSGPNREPQEDFLASLEVAAVSTADAVACYGRRNREDWSRYVGRDVHYVAPPFLPTPFEAAESRPGGFALRGVAIGRLNNWKGILETLEALALCRQRGMDLGILWVGRDVGAPLEGISSMVEHLREAHPHLWGKSFLWEETLEPGPARAAQAQANFALVPSRWDTFNFTAVEALSVGTPLVISSGAGASDLCRDGENALVVPPRDPEALADAMERMADPGLRRRLGEAGRLTVERELAPDLVVRSRLAAYEEAVVRHERRRSLGHAPSLMNPFVWHWQRAVELASREAAVARLPSRSLVRETLWRLASRVPGKLFSRRWT